MTPDPYFQHYAAANRVAQELLWESTLVSIDRQLPDLIDRVYAGTIDPALIVEVIRRVFGGQDPAKMVEMLDSGVDLMDEIREQAQRVAARA